MMVFPYLVWTSRKETMGMIGKTKAQLEKLYLPPQVLKHHAIVVGVMHNILVNKVSLGSLTMLVTILWRSW